MRSKTGRQTNAAFRAQMAAVPEEISGELVLTKPLAAGAAFGYRVIPTELIEENAYRGAGRPEGETARLAFRIRRKTRPGYFTFELRPAPFVALVMVIFVATI
jgi:hypothetical protein